MQKLRASVHQTSNMTPSDVQKVIQILEVLSEILKTLEVKIFKDLIETVDILMQTKNNLTENQRLQILVYTDKFLKNLLRIHMIYNLTTTTTNTVVKKMDLQETELFYDSTTAIKIIGDGQNKNETYAIGVMVFKMFQSMPLNNGNKRTNLMAISVLPTIGLKNKVEITFKNLIIQDYDMKCQVLMSERNTFLWSDSECSTTTEADKNVRCLCNHMSVFSILMSLRGAHTTDYRLVILTKVGLSISVLCLSITLGVFIYLFKSMKVDKAVTHVCLCSSLLISSLIFLLGIDATNNKLLCKVVAASLQYFLLAAQFSMMVEGVQLLSVIIFPFRTKSNWKFCIPIIVGTPLLIVIISMSVASDGFGTPHFCWITNDRGLKWAFVGPVVGVVLFNATVILIVMKTIVGLDRVRRADTKAKIRSAFWAILVLCPLLGVTYGTGLLTFTGQNIIWEFLFISLNAFQGLFFFLFQCFGQSDIRNGLREKIRRFNSRQIVSP